MEHYRLLIGFMNWLKYLNNAFISTVEKKDGKFKLDKKKTLNTIERYVRLKRYEFKEWTPVLLKKDDGGDRPIISPPIQDRILLKALSDYCSLKLKSKFAEVDKISFAYQKGKGTRDALIRLKKQFHPRDVIIKIDIQKFFNNINKEIVSELLQNLNLDEYAMYLINKSLSPKLVHNEAYDSAMSSIQNGIPQGNAVSAVLSNLYLLEFDKLCKAKKIRLIRYADDMVILVENITKAHEVLNFIKEYLYKERGLSIHPLLEGGKTAIYSLPQKPPLTYLGVEFDGSRLLPTLKCQYILSNKVKSLAQKTSVTIDDRIKGIERSINQWCGYYAFTDAPHNQLKRLTANINYTCHKYLDEKWQDFNLEQRFAHYKNKQNRVCNYSSKVYGEEYNWLQCY